MPAKVSFSSPVDWQVFQRHVSEEGPVLISGRVDSPSFIGAVRICIYRQAEGSSPASVPSEGILQSICATPNFSFTITLPAGGWYTLKIFDASCLSVGTGRLKYKVASFKKSVLMGEVKCFGVGEVFVTAGGSNSTNCGEARQQVKTAHVSAFTGRRWQPANDPQPGAQDQSTKGSCWPAFGDSVYSRLKVPIGLVCTGETGASVDGWQPDINQGGVRISGEQYAYLLGFLKLLGPGGFRALMWHQGEVDAYDCATSKEYYSSLVNMIQSIKQEVRWDFPWFVAQASYRPGNGATEAICFAQRKSWTDGVALEGPDTDTLTGAYRNQGGYGIHMSEMGQVALGRMWADKIIGYLEG
ncbi:hypothetical protein CYMTET_12988 [Cymbomonas tetramitiformis]|uniref:Sialate O-acetylesterase domain-containing protein n=1 Tax=Cymbomonas tetramitiformis TaxID=36881 RepID=A0AAE0LBX0_9CHLO|nr:hypothetical protein CYMTET_12988 [Cymbomonas tetramitiformis]